MPASIDTYYPAGVGLPSGSTMGGFSLPMAAPMSGGAMGPAIVPTSAVPQRTQIQTVVWAAGLLGIGLVLLHVLRREL